MLSYRHLGLATGALTLVLFVVLMVAPGWVALLFEFEGNAASEFLSRRAAMLFLAYAAIVVSARNAKPSSARQAILLGNMGSMGGLALLGAVEFARGYAGPGIVAAVLGETAFALWALKVRRAAQQALA